ncbi:MAG: HEPN domain-containing protein [Nitrospirota bacterium]
MIDEKEFQRWFKQAEHNLKSSKADAEDGDYDWACFKAQQASEIAILSFIEGEFKNAKGNRR